MDNNSIKLFDVGCLLDNFFRSDIHTIHRRTGDKNSSVVA